MYTLDATQDCNMNNCVCCLHITPWLSSRVLCSNITNENPIVNKFLRFQEKSAAIVHKAYFGMSVCPSIVFHVQKNSAWERG